MRSQSSRVLLVVAVAATAASANGLAPLVLRDDVYQTLVCNPPTASGEVVPPCTDITTIEELCQPNGTSPLAFKAHQECMCGGSYFPEWPACVACLALHGFRTDRQVAFFDGVLSAASSSFCGTATPTAPWSSIFDSVQSTFSPVTTGATVSTDRAVSQTAVSLYYTLPSGSKQGPGAITGSAALATKTAGPSTSAVNSTRTTSASSASGNGVSTTESGATTGSPSPTTSTKPNGAGLRQPEIAAVWALVAGCIWATFVL